MPLFSVRSDHSHNAVWCTVTVMLLTLDLLFVQLPFLCLCAECPFWCYFISCVGLLAETHCFAVSRAALWWVEDSIKHPTSIRQCSCFYTCYLCTCYKHHAVMFVRDAIFFSMCESIVYSCVKYPTLWMSHDLFIHLSLQRHFENLQLEVMVNAAAISIRILIFMWI